MDEFSDFVATAGGYLPPAVVAVVAGICTTIFIANTICKAFTGESLVKLTANFRENLAERQDVARQRQLREDIMLMWKVWLKQDGVDRQVTAAEMQAAFMDYTHAGYNTWMSDFAAHNEPLKTYLEKGTTV